MPGAMGKLRFDSIGRGREPRTKVSTAAAFCRWITAVVFCGLPVLEVHAQQQPSSSGPVVVQPGAPGTPSRRLPPSTTGVAPQRSQADVEFMQGMIMHHGQAVEMTALIPSHTENKEVRVAGGAHQPLAVRRDEVHEAMAAGARGARVDGDAGDAGYG